MKRTLHSLPKTNNAPRRGKSSCKEMIFAASKSECFGYFYQMFQMHYACVIGKYTAVRLRAMHAFYSCATLSLYSFTRRRRGCVPASRACYRHPPQVLSSQSRRARRTLGVGRARCATLILPLCNSIAGSPPRPHRQRRTIPLFPPIADVNPKPRHAQCRDCPSPAKSATHQRQCQRRIHIHYKRWRTEVTRVKKQRTEPGAFFTGAKSRARTPLSNATSFAATFAYTAQTIGTRTMR